MKRKDKARWTAFVIMIAVMGYVFVSSGDPEGTLKMVAAILAGIILGRAIIYAIKRFYGVEDD